MSKKNKKTKQGTYALCITIGTVVGIGLIPLVDNVVIPILIGVAGGYATAYFFTESKSNKKR